MSRLSLEIARARIDLLPGAGAPPLLPRYGGFAQTSGTARWSLAVGPGAIPLPGQFTGRAIRTGRGLVIEGMEHAGWLDPASGRGQVLSDPSLMVVDGFVRAALCIDVLARGGCLVHAAAVVVDGGAHLVAGRSGSGKSTLAALARHALTDELCAVLPSRDGLEVHGTPWWKGRPGSAPLAGVYRLAWDGEGVVPLRRADGLRHLATNLVLPVDGPEERARAFAAAGRIAAAVPFARLSFRPDSDVDAILRRHAPARAA